MARLFSVGLSLSLLFAGCLGEREAAEKNDPEPKVSRSLGPLDPLSRRFGRLRSRMRERGYDRELAVARTFALEGRGAVVPLDLPVGRCTTIVALAGGAMRDLSLTLYDGDGRQAVMDAVPGEGGLIHVCPQATAMPSPELRERTLPYYLVMRAAAGSGAIVAAGFEAARQVTASFEGLFDDIVAPRVPFAEVEALLGQSRTALRSRGLVPLGEPRLERVAEGEVVRLPVRFEAGRCYTAVAHSDEGVKDVDAFVFDPLGAEVARDLDTEAQVHLEHCPTTSGQHMVEVRAFEGAGAIGIIVLSGPAAQAEKDSALPPPVQAPPHPHNDPVLTITSAAGQLLERGYEAPIFIVRDATIAPGEVRTHEALFVAGCTTVIGAASAPSMDLDVYLVDTEERLVDRDTGIQSVTRVMACLETPTILRLTVKGYGSDGSYALAMVRAPERLRRVLDLRLDFAAATFGERGYQVQATESLVLGEGESHYIEVSLDEGTCEAFVAAGSSNIEDVDLFLRDKEGTLMASDSGPGAQAIVSRCAEGPEELRLEARVYRGEDSVTIQRLALAP